MVEDVDPAEFLFRSRARAEEPENRIKNLFHDEVIINDYASLTAHQRTKAKGPRSAVSVITASDTRRNRKPPLQV